MQSTQLLDWPSVNRALRYLSIFSLLLCNVVSSENPSTRNEASLQGRRYDSLGDNCVDQPSSLMWSHLLEDYVLSQSSSSVRKSKDMIFMNDKSDSYFMNTPINYHSSAYRRPEMFITKRIGEPSYEGHMRPPQTMHYHPPSQPMTNQMLKQQQRQQPGFFQQLFGLGTTEPPPQQHQQQIQPIRPPSPQFGGPPTRPQNFRAVTENDLYLLGAIEKLVYRVDYLESRIRRSEQLIYYLMAGNNQKEVRDPCPANFTRISENCYYINSENQVNWKTANSACKALSSQLTEFEKVSENEEIMAYLLNQKQHRGRDYWLGGLNPGLLWIWSNSAKPVNPNMNLTSFIMNGINETISTTESNLIDGDTEDNKTGTETTSNNSVEIKGEGRCLRFSYNTGKHSYDYFGEECTSRHNYICEYHDMTLDNKIKKIARDLKLFL